MATVKITDAETFKRGVNANLFHPYNDPITLRLTIVYTVFQPQLRILRPVVQLTFQIIELRTNQVVEHWLFQAKPTPGENYGWLDIPTADDLGLNWVGSDIFGFRGAAELFSDQSKSIDAQDVSEVHWFRFEALGIE